MNKKNLLALLVVIIFLIVGFVLVKYLPKSSPAQIPSNIKYLEIGGQKVKVDLALTSAEQTEGLSGRESLSPNTGMLFVFNKPGYYPFWMPNMNFSIDMIWLAPSGGGDVSKAKIDYIEKDATPESYPAIFGPKDNNSVYVLEVPNGFSDKNNLQIGESVDFIYQ
jgi:hypothetical protein